MITEATGANYLLRLHQVTHDAWESVIFLQTQLQDLEGPLDIGEHWTPEDAEYQRAMEYQWVRTYQVAVDKLEGLVVQRLFELTKANVSETGKCL